MKYIARQLSRHSSLQPVPSFLLVLTVVVMIALTVTTSPRAWAQRRPTSARRIEVEDLLEDLESARRILKSMHPGLYLYTNEDALKKSFGDIAQSLDSPSSPAQLLVAMAPAIEMIRCGHTYLMPPHRQQEMMEQRGRLFPIPVVFVSDKLLVDHAKLEVPLGAEIVTVNDIPVDTLVRQLQPLVPCDGFVTGSRRANLAFEFAEVYAVLHGQPRTFKVGYRTPGNRDIEFTELTPVTGRELVDLFESRHSHGEQDVPFSIDKLGEDTVLLTINSLEFDDYRRGDGAFRSFLRNSFAAIARNQKIQNLVLDLRRNSGGYVNHEIRLHSYLVEQPFREMQSAELKTITIAQKELLDPYWHSSGLTRYMERRLSREFDPTSDGGYVVDDQFNPPHDPRRHHFDGTLYILTSGRTHSAAASLCSMLNRDGPTVFVGEETGGVCSTFTAGNILTYRLPHSRIQLNVPIIQYHMRGGHQQLQPGRGVLPDHPVAATQETFISGQDRALEKVRMLIHGK